MSALLRRWLFPGLRPLPAPPGGPRAGMGLPWTCPSRFAGAPVSQAPATSLYHSYGMRGVGRAEPDRAAREAALFVGLGRPKYFYLQMRNKKHSHRLDQHDFILSAPSSSPRGARQDTAACRSLDDCTAVTWAKTERGCAGVTAREASALPACSPWAP